MRENIVVQQWCLVSQEQDELISYEKAHVQKSCLGKFVDA